MKFRNISDTICVICAVTLIFSFGLSFIAIPKRSFSEQENRVLASFPQITLRSLADGDFFTDLSAYCKDHFPLRQALVSLRARAELLLGKKENNGVIFASGSLIARNETNEKILNGNLAGLSEIIKSTNIPTHLCVAPRAVDVLSFKLPQSYNTADTQTAYSIIGSYIPEYVNPLESLKSAAQNGEYVWYNTDHHWTTDGAYIAYTQIAEGLGVEPYAKDSFSAEAVSDGFLGTTFSKSGISSYTPDTVTLLRYGGDGILTVYNHEAQRQGQLYDMAKLNEKDKYLVFLGGNYSRITVTDESAVNRPKLLLIKDSFANALVPFLARHFDLDIIDPRYNKDGIPSLTRDNRYAAVLLVLGVQTLESTRLFY